MNHKKKIAIILFNLGGPDKLSSVKPFLFNLFNDFAIINWPQPFRFLLARFISSRREKKSQKIYAQIGGKSPILDISEAQAHALEKELSFFGDFKVFVSMRYWHPMSQQVIKNIFSYQPERLILLPLYPQFSSTTTASSFTDFLEKFSAEKKKRNVEIVVQQVCCYFEEPEFILAHAKLVKKTIARFYDNLQDLRLLFSAHGLPKKLIDQGDPYVFQIEKTAEKIVENLQQLLQKEGHYPKNSSINLVENKPDLIKFDTKVCYQSKVGPLEWTGPSLENEIRRAALDKKIPVIIPVSFVSEHSETLVELDIDYRNLAKTLGIRDYLRVPALNTDGDFIQSLVEICKKVSTSEGEIFSGCEAKRACGSKFKMCCNNSINT